MLTEEELLDKIYAAEIDLERLKKEYRIRFVYKK